MRKIDCDLMVQAVTGNVPICLYSYNIYFDTLTRDY